MTSNSTGFLSRGPLALCGLLSDAVKSDFRALVEQRDLEVSSRALSSIAGNARDYISGPGYEDKIFLILQDAISKRAPFSAVRLGDGEGNILAAINDNYSSLTDFSIQRILSIMFGRSHYSRATIQSMSIEMRSSIEGADVVGIPSNSRLRATYESIERAPNREAIDYRGCFGVISAVLCLTEIALDRQVLTDCYFHRDLIDRFEHLLYGQKEICIISCYESLPDLISSRFHASIDKFYPIPNQSSNMERRPSQDHLGMVWPMIAESLAVPTSGKLFLVSAGILGNIYCDYVKKGGGTAINIGSIVDVWVGKPSRPYHTAEYVGSHKIDF
jgi:hypothetical protein